LLCSVGALGLYLFWRWHIRGESTPNFRSYSSWYPVKLLAARDDRTGTQELGYKSQYEATWRAFVLAGISSVQKTHVMRGYGARAAEVHGVSEKQVSYEWISRSATVIIISWFYDIVGRKEGMEMELISISTIQISRAGGWDPTVMVQTYLLGQVHALRGRLPEGARPVIVKYNVEVVDTYHIIKPYHCSHIVALVLMFFEIPMSCNYCNVWIYHIYT
jgi:hypothetical protein